MEKGIRKHGKLLAILVIIFLSGCMQQLKDLNSALSRTNAALAPGGAGLNMPNIPSMPQLSEPQMQALHSQLISRVNDRAIL
jgi:hypothetical protein